MKSFVFRLHVKHGKLFATDRIAGRDAYNWSREPCIRLDRGNYRAEMFILDDAATEARQTSFFLMQAGFTVYLPVQVRGRRDHSLRRYPRQPVRLRADNTLGCAIFSESVVEDD